jgi:hypothetical protein
MVLVQLNLRDPKRRPSEFAFRAESPSEFAFRCQLRPAEVAFRFARQMKAR